MVDFSFLEDAIHKVINKRIFTNICSLNDHFCKFRKTYKGMLPRKHNHTDYCIQKQLLCCLSKHSFVLILNYEFWNFWKLRINRFSHIIKRWSSQNNSTRPHYACQCKQPQEQAIQDHGNIFPILYYLFSWMCFPLLMSILSNDADDFCCNGLMPVDGLAKWKIVAMVGNIMRKEKRETSKSC